MTHLWSGARHGVAIDHGMAMVGVGRDVGVWIAHDNTHSLVDACNDLPPCTQRLWKTMALARPRTQMPSTLLLACRSDSWYTHWALLTHTATHSAAHVVWCGLWHLQGHYNIHVEHGKYMRPSSSSSRRRAPDTPPLSVRGAVHRLIREATSSENLSAMYIGWMPFL